MVRAVSKYSLLAFRLHNSSSNGIACTRFASQVQSPRLIMEQDRHVWIQLPLDASGIPGRGGEHENISAQQILWLRFLGHRFLDLPAWGNALQISDQRIHHVRGVTAGRGKDDMEESTLNEVRDSLGGIGSVAHELSPLFASDGSRLTDPDASNR
jgi:hypothetical protein